MQVKVIGEAGYDAAMIGLSLSYGQPLSKMAPVALRLAKKGEPHCKFARMMHVWLDVTAPWYWWKQAVTYRVGMEVQSGSTMHNILKRELTQADFEGGIEPDTLERLNAAISHMQFDYVVRNLPGAYLYRRVLDVNYSTLARMIVQRRGHKLPEWELFTREVLAAVEWPELLEAMIEERA
jgi:hypothetical protein